MDQSMVTAEPNGLIRIPTPEAFHELPPMATSVFPREMLPETPPSSPEPLPEITPDYNPAPGYMDLGDLQQVLYWLHSKFPLSRPLPEEDQKSMLRIIVATIQETYPRYDRYTLMELVTMLEDYITPEILSFLEDVEEEVEEILYEQQHGRPDDQSNNE